MEQTIRARNKKTGEVFEGTVQEARDFGFSDAFIVKKLKAAKEVSELTGGTQNKQITGIQDVLNITKELPTGGERTSAQDALLFGEQVKGALDALSASEQEGILGVKGSGPLANILSKAAGTAGIDTKQAALRDQLDNLRQLIRKERTGVQFSKQEVKELESIFGSITTQEGPLRRKLEDLLARSVNEAATRTGVERTELEKLFSPSGSEQQEKGRGFISEFLSPITDLGKDLGTGLALRGKEGDQFFQSQQQAINVANQAFQKAQETQDPEQKARLQKVAQDTLDQVGLNSEDIASRFSESIDKPTLQRGLEFGATAATLAEAPALASLLRKTSTGTISFAKNVPTNLKAASKSVARVVNDLFTDKTIAPKLSKEALEEGIKIANRGETIRTQAVELATKTGEKVDGDIIFKGLEKWRTTAKRIFTTPSNRKKIDELVNGLQKNLKGKKLNPETARGIWDSADSGFTSAGKAGKPLTQSFNRAYREATRKALDKAAPGFDEGTKLIREGLKKEKLLKGVRTGLERTEIKEGLKETVVEPGLGKRAIRGITKRGGSLATGAILARLLLGGRNDSRF